MNPNATFEKLSLMRLNGFERAYRQIVESAQQEAFTLDQIIAHLIDAEYDERYNKKLSRLLKQAAFKQQASFEQIDFSAQRGLDKNNLLRLKTCDWIKKSRDLLITGATGVGKSFLACAIGFEACVNEYKVQYTTSNRLFESLILAKADGTYLKQLDKLRKIDLLIIDDFGVKKIDNHICTILLDIIDDRHNCKSTVISSQLPVKAWYECIAEPTIADAVLDRIVNGSYRFELKGESMRKLKKYDQ